jgi:hypothetical protein
MEGQEADPHPFVAIAPQGSRCASRRQSDDNDQLIAI